MWELVRPVDSMAQRIPSFVPPQGSHLLNRTSVAWRDLNCALDSQHFDIFQLVQRKGGSYKQHPEAIKSGKEEKASQSWEGRWWQARAFQRSSLSQRLNAVRQNCFQRAAQRHQRRITMVNSVSCMSTNLQAHTIDTCFLKFSFTAQNNLYVQYSFTAANKSISNHRMVMLRPVAAQPPVQVAKHLAWCKSRKDCHDLPNSGLVTDTFHVKIAFAMVHSMSILFAFFVHSMFVLQNQNSLLSEDGNSSSDK